MFLYSDSEASVEEQDVGPEGLNKVIHERVTSRKTGNTNQRKGVTKREALG